MEPKKDELYHHGIKGMKWGEWNDDTRARYSGVRVKRDSSSNDKDSVKTKIKKFVEDTPKKVSDQWKKHMDNRPKKMSDQELESAVRRLKKEVEYRDLKKKAEPGKAYASQILQDVGKKVIVTASAGAILYGLRVALGDDFNAQALASAVFNGGAKKK